MRRLSTIFIIFIFIFLVGCDQKNEKEYVNVSYDTNGGSHIDSQRIEKGAKIIEPEDPYKEGYSFDGWVLDDETWDFDQQVFDNIVLKANWIVNNYTLMIRLNNGDNDIILNLDYNSDITFKLPKREGYSLSWSEDIPEKMPAENKVIDAIWTINQYTLTLKLNNGEDDIVMTQDYNSEIEYDNPQKEGYSLIWTDEIPKKMPAENMTIEAIWVLNLYTLTIKLNNGDDDIVIRQYYNTKIEVDIPQKKGHTFVKWSDDIPETMPAENKTIEALWSVNKYTLTINLGFDNSYITITQDYDTELNISLPKRPGYTLLSYSIPRYMPAENKTIEAKWSCDVKYKINDNGITITGLNTTNLKDLVILEEYDGKKVVAIDSDAFSRCTSLVSITIPNSVIEIGTHAFSFCTNLISIIIPNSVKDIGEYLFYGCTSLANVTFGDSIKKIPAYTFYDCTDLKELKISNNITFIGNSAFRECTSLETIVIPGSVAWIGPYAFKDCTSLKSVKILNGVKEIRDLAFQDCTSLESITIPQSIIDTRLPFIGCSSLTLYCEFSSKPESWATNWNCYYQYYGEKLCPVVWGYVE